MNYGKGIKKEINNKNSKIKVFNINIPLKHFRVLFNIQKGNPNNDNKNFTNSNVYNCCFYLFAVVRSK